MVISLNQYCLNAKHCHWIIYWAWFIQVKRTFGRNKWFIWYQFTAVQLIIFFVILRHGKIKLSETNYSLYTFLNEISRNSYWTWWLNYGTPQGQDWISDVIFRYLFLCWEGIVHFVDMGGIVDQDCLNLLVYTTSYWNQKQMLNGKRLEPVWCRWRTFLTTTIIKIGYLNDICNFGAG